MKKKYKIGFTYGVFDLFHIGHLNILRRAKSYCDELIVGVTTDELAQKVKHKKPVISFEERSDIVNNIKYVDKVIPISKIDKIGVWEELQFDIIFKGDDWKGTEKGKNLEKEFKKRGVKVCFLPYTKTTSSTLVRNVLNNIYNSTKY